METSTKIYQPHFIGGFRKRVSYKTRTCEDKTSEEAYYNEKEMQKENSMSVSALSSWYVSFCQSNAVVSTFSLYFFLPATT